MMPQIILISDSGFRPLKKKHPNDFFLPFLYYLKTVYIAIVLLKFFIESF